MLTTYVDHFQNASAGAQIAGTLLAFVAIGFGPFAPGLNYDHVRAYRASR